MGSKDRRRFPPGDSNTLSPALIKFKRFSWSVTKSEKTGTLATAYPLKARRRFRSTIASKKVKKFRKGFYHCHAGKVKVSDKVFLFFPKFFLTAFPPLEWSQEENLIIRRFQGLVQATNNISP